MPSVRGPEYSLTSFRGDKNVVLVFYRAWWCTNCRAQLKELAARYSEIEALNAEVLAVSTDNLKDAGYIVNTVGVPFPVLFDTEATVPLAYGVFNHFGDGLATTSTLVIDKAGFIRWVFVGENIADQAATDDVLEQLKLLEG